MNNEYADFYSTTPLEESWDPVEELTYLLQDAASAQAAQQTAPVPPPRNGRPYGTEPVYGPAEPSYGNGTGYGPDPSYGTATGYGGEPPYGTEPPYGPEPSHGTGTVHAGEPPYGPEPAYGPEPRYGPETPSGTGAEPAHGTEHGTGDPLENLARITSELPPIRRHPAGHRKVRTRKLRITWLQTVSFLIAALAAAIVAMVSVFGGLAAYAPLQHIAASTRSGPLRWWPLLVYGPWMVASLSVLRTALHRRRALHSWCVVLLFSSVAMTLCVAEAERSFTGVAAAVLPALAALTCFQQLVRQVTLTRPPRQRISRHRQRTAQAARDR
ncbi:DUF2637 domain-containing protein [Streptomyces sp. NPDC059168]|uniref:DUF2637 domain-containing protein n=1 Tax=Streptomyces sp. NPDC059168 TaxID=3346753 RepID=UPI00369E7B27